MTLSLMYMFSQHATSRRYEIHNSKQILDFSGVVFITFACLESQRWNSSTRLLIITSIRPRGNQRNFSVFSKTLLTLVKLFFIFCSSLTSAIKYVAWKQEEVWKGALTVKTIFADKKPQELPQSVFQRLRGFFFRTGPPRQPVASRTTFLMCEARLTKNIPLSSSKSM